ncbi:MAG: hypothetical protein WCF68_16115 [Terriglobales bacterium]
MIVTEFIVLALALSTMNDSPNTKTPPVAPVHVSNTFHFLVHAPLHMAAPLFGPEGERGWAGDDWDPQFLYPQPAKDIPGAVFTIQRGQQKSVWITTQFDLDKGRMQYVSVVPGIKASTVDVTLTAVDDSTTSVEVTYIRTALDAAANEEVQALGRSDLEEGPHWQEAIDTYLKEQRNKTH